MLGLALAIIAGLRLRDRQSRIAGLALMCGALVISAGGTTLIQQATAGVGLQIVNSQGATTLQLEPNVSNIFVN